MAIRRLIRNDPSKIVIPTPEETRAALAGSGGGNPDDVKIYGVQAGTFMSARVRPVTTRAVNPAQTTLGSSFWANQTNYVLEVIFSVSPSYRLNHDEWSLLEGKEAIVLDASSLEPENS